MSLLRRLPKSDDEDDSADLNGANLPEISDTLQLYSAWSVWPSLKKINVLKEIAEQVKLSAVPHYPPEGYAIITTDGTIYANPYRLASAGDWLFILAHLLIHLGLRHRPTTDPVQAAAQESAAQTLLNQLLGLQPVQYIPFLNELGTTDATLLSHEWKKRNTLPIHWEGSAGPERCDVSPPIHPNPSPLSEDQWAMLLTQGWLAAMPGQPVDRAQYAPWVTAGMSRARQSIHYFIAHYPLLSALASHFNVIEDSELIQGLGIQIAAVLADRMEIFVNPDAHLTLAEMQFVMAHELLHVGLLHHKREDNRDHFVWNIACDFVINGWLKELGIGEMPKGGLYDPSYAGMSSEEIYDRLMKDAKYVQMLYTFRGQGVGDMLPNGTRGGARRIGARVIDDQFAEELMKQGIDAHVSGKRGLLPAGMVELITPTKEKPPAWKIGLTRWFDLRFEPNVPARTFARLSRRQSATPDIPRPRYALPQHPDSAGVFGVVLDTSGSMHTPLLGRGLGAIAALARKHRVPKVRLVFCDVSPHDEGYVTISRLEQPIHVKGRGGTKLQPGIDLLVNADDFPKSAPILIITDGECDVLTLKRDHAYLIPEGRRLPFSPMGSVFKLT
jgi:predicted metal-dependent peptidase